MPLAPAPILPGASPLPPAGQRPPSPRATRVAAAISLVVLLVTMALGSVALRPLLFFEPMLQAQVGGTDTAKGGAAFQGFVYTWTRRHAATITNGGFTSPASLDNLRLQANTFHMNAVIIPVIANMPVRSIPYLAWHPGDAANLDTLPDSDYEQVIKDARKVGLIPILQLTVRQQDSKSRPSEDPTYIGRAWDNQPSNYIYYDYPYGSKVEKQFNALDAERLWFDQYAAFAAHFARMSQKYSLPYFIIGDQLNGVTADGNRITLAADPKGVDTNLGGEQLNCSVGRRDCEWRHVINAIRGDGYNTYQHKPAPEGGGRYAGKLIYSSYYEGEFEHITWWDAVDYIGVAAFFPLARDRAGVSPDELTDIWHGRGDVTNGQGDIFARLQKVSDKYFKPIIFTAAGYESLPGSNGRPGQAKGTDADQDEQLNDMQALTHTFDQQAWWDGVFWQGEVPAPHNSQPNWATGMNWAGDTLATSKAAGQWLASYNKPGQIPCAC